MQGAEPGSAAKAAQAEGEATMMSAPSLLRGAPTGRNMRGGEAADTLRSAGKAMTRDSSTLPLAEAVALQGRVVLEGGGAAAERHTPAVAAVVAGGGASPQQRQEAQPGVTSALEAQQQPPRHRLVPQSMLEAQASPG